MIETTRRLCLGLLIGMLSFAGVIEGQAKDAGLLGQRNTFGVMAEYSNDSSHIILGDAENVKLGAVGLQYQRRLIANRHLVWSYAMEFRPAIVESIPTAIFKTVQTLPSSQTFANAPELVTRCVTFSKPYTYTDSVTGTVYAGTVSESCGRESTYAQGFSPFGMRLNLRPRSRLQPSFSSHEGYIFSTQPLPISSAGSFNFCFEVGFGLEYYRTQHSSMRFEYLVQHYSNHNTAYANPGVDNGLFKLTYTFGR